MFPGSSGKSRFTGTWFGKMPWLTKLCFLWLILVVLAAALADLIPGLADPNYQGFVFGDGKTNEGPTASHWLGTDNVSRDILARLIYGARVSLIFAFSLAAIGIIVGGTLGSIAGYFRGLLETFLMALVDTWLSFPALIGLVVHHNDAWNAQPRSPSAWSVPSSSGRRTHELPVPPPSRSADRPLSPRQGPLAPAGNGSWFGKSFPNVLPALLAYSLVGLPILIILESTLSFLGLGVEIPTASWGGMINQARQDLLINIWPAVWPAVTLFMTVYSFNNLADWVRTQAAARSAAI